MDFDFDYIIVGSGFGGSVSALRLSEKGYKVLVLEAGKRFNTEDFPTTNWDAKKFLWAPKFGLHGIMRMTFLKDVLILSGAGVGGGSLVYANTLLVPPKKIFKPEVFGAPAGEDVFETLAPHYATAQRMLGVTQCTLSTPADKMLKAVAEDYGKGDTYHNTTVGVYFGKPSEKVPDPFFGGEGPDRVGCTLCGGCMVGCRVGAKNTLDRNYLYLAEKYGAQVMPETLATLVEPLSEGGYKVHIENSLAHVNKYKRSLTAKNVVFSGGVLGTVKLLLASRDAGKLTKLSPRLGDFVRTNAEAIIGVQTRDPKLNFSEGISITSGVYPDPDTHIEVVRYPEGSDAIALLATVLTDGGPGMPRPVRFLKNVLMKPLDFLRTLNPFGWARKTIILLVMQTVDNHMKLRLKRSWWWPFGEKGLSSYRAEGQTKPPGYIPIANEFAKRLAAKIDGVAQSSINEVLFDVPTTAHVMGGACIGSSPENGVIDRTNKVFGYEGLYVIDGSMIPSNLGVNPSLTITSLAEHAMSYIPPKPGAQVRTPIIGIERLLPKI